jgi:site-specific recombinase XerD
MPRVVTGKVAIPGDRIEAYLAALAEETRRPFRQSLEELRAEFEQHLAAKYSRKTVRTHAQIVALFVDFLCDYTDVEAIEAISRGMANSAIRQWYRRKVLDAASADDLRVALKKFFQFLATEKEIRNPKVLASLR